ncbi:microcystin-dependent protein [Sphingomonas sp. UYAg733]
MSDYFLGEIRMFPWDWPPKTWALCNGATLGIAQNQALFALLGTIYGGNGTTTFNLPDLRGRVILGMGQLAGGSFYPEGALGGVENVTLVTSQIPAHNHMMIATAANGAVAAAAGNYLSNAQTTPAGGSDELIYVNTTANSVALAGTSISSTGGSAPHNNMQPYLTVNYCIATQGIFPSRN